VACYQIKSNKKEQPNQKREMHDEQNKKRQKDFTVMVNVNNLLLTEI